MKIFELQSLSFKYGTKEILSGISFEIKPGESFGIIGPNGSGKSTLLRVMSGLLSKFAGDIFLQGKSIQHYSKKELAKIIAFVGQEGTPPLPFTVHEVVAMGRYPWLKPFANLSAKDDEVIKNALILMNLWEKRNSLIQTLSGGERQLVALARAMVQEPKILFLDEPTTYLDIGHQVLVLQLVRKWQEEKDLTVVMVLHDLNLAAQYCDRLLLMKQGNIQRIGKVVEVLRKEHIEEVYQTKTIMVKHPELGIPQVLLPN
ncbi:ABC transporter ATP-binding protein [Tepidibacillus infernus]|uniref:ABC transporter ATP-binding protein n=1 Tax=Tepidibacillus infernus TaxID=1806172 RepID=UPI003B726028